MRRKCDRARAALALPRVLRLAPHRPLRSRHPHLPKARQQRRDRQRRCQSLPVFTRFCKAIRLALPNTFDRTRHESRPLVPTDASCQGGPHRRLLLHWMRL